MKSNALIILSAGIFLTLGGSIHAQEGGGRPEGREHRQPPPPPPIVAAIDTDKDGEISAEEIAKAAESLKALDKDGDGKLSREELRPQRGPEGGPGGGQKRPGGPGRRGPEGGPGNGGPRG